MVAHTVYMKTTRHPEMMTSWINTNLRRWREDHEALLQEVGFDKSVPTKVRDYVYKLL